MRRKILAENINSLPVKPILRAVLVTLYAQMAQRLQGPRKIYVYGSQARGDWDEDSDLDILVIIDKEKINLVDRESIFSKVCTIAADVYLDCKEEIPVIMPVCLSKDIYELTEANLENKITPAFVAFIKKGGVLIYDETEDA